MNSLRALALVFCNIFSSGPSCRGLRAGARADGSGGAAFQEPTPPPPPPADITVPGAVAQLLPDGTAAAPADAPPQVQQAIWAANKIQDKPYIYGGGHGDFEDDGYDCSGTVSYALHGGGLLDTALDSGSFMRWGEKRRRPVDHGLRELRPRLRRHRRPATGHERRVGHAAPTRASSRRRSSAARAGGRRQRSSRGYKKRHPVGF